ncbi:MAG: hypothetical protein PHV99_02965 [Candidatus Pacebacteria bacterium]|nr:hypothetical protein [Candidatus Paceibacterota bacterium]
MADDKYIRTFGGDVEAIQKGDKPELVPLHHAEAFQEALRGAPAPASSERLVEAPALPLVPAPAPAPLENKIKTEPALSEERPIVPLKTYASDFSRRMKETQASAVTVLAAEQDEAPRVPELVPTKENVSRTNLIYGIAGGVLLIGGIVGVYIAYSALLSAEAPPVVIAPTIATPIFVDEHTQISGSGDALLLAMAQSVGTLIKQGAVRLLSLETATSSNMSIFSALALPAPGALTRNIQPAQSMAGVVFVNGKQSPFFILSVASYGDTFAAMLAWEPLMLRDLAKLFPQYPAPRSVAVPVPEIATTTATTSSQSRQATTTAPAPAPVAAPVSVAAFYDTTVANHDARAYRDTSGRTLLIYGYWDQKTLIIARDDAAFTEIVRRLATSRSL